MYFAFKLDSLIGRIALVIFASAVCGALVWSIYSHFVIRFVTDPRLLVSSEALTVTAKRFPNSPRVHLRLARAEMADAAGQEQMISDAISHAERAANLSRWDYRIRRLLGALQEMSGDAEGAEKSLLAAAQLAPNNTEVNWALANLLIRRGKLGESLKPFRKATRSNDDLLPMAFELLWQSSGGDLDTLKMLAGTDSAAQLSLVQFLVDQSLSSRALSSQALSSQALNIFRRIDRDSKLNSARTGTFINSLIGAGQYESARALWLDLVGDSTGPAPSPGGLIWNGGFELDPVKNFGHFDWTILPSEHARIGIDAGVARSGTRSLKVAFTGRDTTTLNGELKQLIVLRPGGRYRLECYAKAGDLVTPEGPRIAIMGPKGVMAASDPVPEGSTDWQRLVIDFTGPDDSSATFIGVVRLPRFSYDDPTRGAVWFDDFTLRELAQNEQQVLTTKHAKNAKIW